MQKFGIPEPFQAKHEDSTIPGACRREMLALDSGIHFADKMLDETTTIVF